MLLHLQQSLAAHPALVEGQAPLGLLHPSEQAQLDAFRVVKRRRDWLLGRWTAKHLVQQYLAQTLGGETPPLRAILIVAAADGSPQVILDPQYAISNLQSPISISISHSGDRAFCALTDEPEARVGADIERVEPRETGFVDQFFTPDEIAAISAAPPNLSDTLITAIWSAKEAVLKALRVGLRADTRHVRCEFPDVQAYSPDWAPFQVELQAPHLSLSHGARLIGWWRLCPEAQPEGAEDAYVQTLALLSPVGTVPDHYPFYDPGFLP